MAAYPWLAVKYREGFSERMGHYPALPWSGKNPLWVHAVSVGEVQAAWPLLREARRNGWDDPLVLTTITRTGRKMAENLVGTDADLMAYYPWDAPWVVERAINSISPAAYVTVETEVWPNFIFGLAERGIPAFIANGRFSERSFRKAVKNREFWRRVMSVFRLIMVRGEDDASRLKELGLDPSKVIADGDCKVDALLIRKADIDPESVKNLIRCGDAPVLIAGSTHPGEDEVVLDAFRIVRESVARVKLILVPRHPERSSDVGAMAAVYGRVARLSDPQADWDILIVDEVGRLFGLYSIARSAFVGGSLVPKGGQNILEPAAWGVPVKHGPHMEDFCLHSQALSGIGAAARVTGSRDLARSWVKDLLEGNNKEPAGRKYVESLGGASALTWARIRDTLNSGE